VGASEEGSGAPPGTALPAPLHQQGPNPPFQMSKKQRRGKNTRWPRSQVEGWLFLDALGAPLPAAYLAFFPRRP